MYRWILRGVTFGAGLAGILVTASPSAAQTPPRLEIRATSAPSPFRIDGKLDEAALRQRSADCRFHSDGAGRRAAGDGEDRGVGLLRRRNNVYVTMRAWESRPDAHGRQRNAARQQQHPHGRLRRVLARHVPRPAQRLPVRGQPARRADRRAEHQRAAVQRATGTRCGIWRSAQFEGGWTVEAAIPFKSLRYQPGAAQIWGFNARRNNKWKNEISFLARMPPAFGIGRGSFAASLFPHAGRHRGAAGLEEPRDQAVRDRRSDHRSRRRRRRSTNDPDGDVGLDVKYGVTQSLTADFTYNTDFAQVEADEQQVNLTRFSLFFPEKREFFLENQGMFAFGGAGGGRRRGSAQRRHADPVLQPAHRPQRRAGRCRFSAAAA